MCDKLKAHSGIQLRANTLAACTTLRTGGSARLCVSAHTRQALVDAVRICDEAHAPSIVLGGGSNVVIADGDLDVVAILVRCDDVDIDPARGIVRADAGVVWDDLVSASIDAGLGGLECLSGIPGSAGATPVQNVGAYGVEISSVLTRVQLYDRTTGATEWVSADTLDLAYRYSNLKYTNRAIVLAIELQLDPEGMSAPIRYGELARALGIERDEYSARRPAGVVRHAVLALRRSKGMVLDDDDPDTHSVGSFFTNPVVPLGQVELVRNAARTCAGAEVADAMPAFPCGDDQVKLSAAWLVQHFGVGRDRRGEGYRARVSSKHTLALCNYGGATTAEVVELAQRICTNVRDKAGVKLVPEPVFIGHTWGDK